MKILISLFCLLLFSCNLSDVTKELSGDYFLRIEGKGVNDILSHSENNEIPSDVLRYGYNENFIIAEQKPNSIQDALYSKKYEYTSGINSLYYWIIVHNKKTVFGPMNKTEFEKARIEEKVPNDLKLTDVHN